MRAEIITVGDEILIGQIVDTNSAWLGKRLNDLGVRVIRITSIQDTGEAIVESLDRAFSDVDLILMTGGLGPTKDDLTKHTLAGYFHSPLVRHQPTYDYLAERITSKGMRFNVLNQAQADVPEGCTVIPNRNGTAPGMWFEKEGKVLISMPGVPFEMKGMMTDTIFGRIRDHFRLDRIVHKTVLTYGLPESELALRIAPWEENLPEGLKLAYLPNPNNIRLRLSDYHGSEDAERRIEAQFDRLRSLIPDHFLGYENPDATLEGTVATIMKERHNTLSIAESCTGGALAARFTAMAGASEYFLGGVVAYSNSLKNLLLGVPREEIETYGAVSREVAVRMAEGMRRITGSDYALSTTGIAGPDGGTPEKPVGTVWMAVAGPEGTVAEKKIFGDLREQNIQRASSHVTDMLRQMLLTTNRQQP